MNEQKEREKFRGIISGSNTQEECRARHELGVQIIKENNFKIAKSKFYSEYEQRIARTSTVKNVTKRTLYRDYKHIKELIKNNYNIDFEFYSSSKTKKITI